MPGDPKYARVAVTLRKVSPLDFDVTSTDLPMDADRNLVFRNNGHPGFKILFDLDDQTGENYRFPTNSKKQDGVWSKRGTKCPDTAASDIFKVVEIPPHRQTMVVHNLNPQPAQGEFRYTLRVTKDGGKNYLPLDPGGVNQNGPSRAMKSLSAASIVLGVVAGSLLTLGAQQLF